jgi:hypothetical protein
LSSRGNSRADPSWAAANDEDIDGFVNRDCLLSNLDIHGGTLLRKKGLFQQLNRIRCQASLLAAVHLMQGIT